MDKDYDCMKKRLYLLFSIIQWTISSGQESIDIYKVIPGKWAITRHNIVYYGNTNETVDVELSKNYYEFKQDSTYTLAGKPDKGIEQLNSGKWRLIPSENKLLLYDNSVDLKIYDNLGKISRQLTDKIKDYHLILNLRKNLTQFLLVKDDDSLKELHTLFYNKIE